MISASEARRIALAALGFDRPRPRRVDPKRIARTIRELGLVQIDSVNVLAQAHYLVLYSRLGPYPRSRLDDAAYRSGEFTEQWAHEASIIPIETWPLLRHRMATFRLRPYGFEKFLQEHSRYVDWVYEQIRERGPLTAADLPEPAGVERRVGGDWFSTVPRVVLESLFARGRLAIAERRQNFSRAYDLAERLIPEPHRERVVDPVEANRDLIRKAARAYGIATAEDLADYYRMPVKDARPRIAELLEEGDLERVQVEGWRAPAYLDPEARLPRRVEAAALVSPFDPLVWRRERASRLFGFDYRIEIYTPAAQRKYGYYVLPFLLGERLVARVDLKADRGKGLLLAQSAHLEPGVCAREVESPLKAELRTLADWLGLDDVRWCGF